MPRLENKRVIAAVLLGSMALVAGCQRMEAPDADEAVLRIHDVTGLQVESLDKKINELLSREDLPLRGRVELLDENRLAVNASRHLQQEIADMLAQLGEASPDDQIDRSFRIRFWLLTMDRGEGSGDVPQSVSRDLQALLSEFEGYSLSVDDYIETYHNTATRIRHVMSGEGARVFLRSAEATSSGIELRGEVNSRGQNSAIRYQIDHELVPGKALVLGTVHNGGGDGYASYQVLVAQAEWTASTD